MITPPMPPDEPQRIEALRNLHLLDTPAEEGFDAVVRLAAHLLDTPIALISLVDEDRQWFKARFGLDTHETERNIAVCAHAIAEGTGDLFVVNDATRDDRFADNPLVLGDPHMRAYAGRPLRAGGHLVGTLCVIDRRAREFTDAQRVALHDLGTVVDELLSRRSLRSVLTQMADREARHAQILATMHDGLVMQDMNGAIVEWNESAERVLGLSGDELGGRQSIDPRWGAIHDDGTPWAGDTHPAMVALNTGQAVEEALMGLNRPKRGLGWLRVNSTPIRDDAGDVTGVITSFADVTELINSERNLRLLEALQRSTLDSLEQGVIVARRGGTIELMNAAARHILGYEPDELTSRWRSADWPGLEPDGSIDADRAHSMLRRLDSGNSIDGEIIGWTRVDGQFVLLRLSARPLPDDDEGFVLSFLDISQAQHDQQLIALTFNQAPIGMAMVDHVGLVMNVNDALCQYLSRRREELIGTSFADITHPDDVDDFRRRSTELLDGHGTRFEIDQRYVDGTGGIRHARLAVGIVRAPVLDRPYFITQLVDISGRIEAEHAKDLALATERAAVAKWVELDQIKSEFVDTVSHELRTPLAAMIGYIELLRDDELSPQQAAMLGIVDDSALRLQSMIEDLLGLTERLPEPSAFAVVDVASLARTVCDDVSHAAAHAGLTMHLSPTDTGDDPLETQGDRNRLERALRNVLDNAVKFTPHGGAIEVSVRRLRAVAEIEVSDTGIGIPADDLAAVLTPFFRSSAVVRDAVPGSGLGLAIAAGIIEHHGGTIEVRPGHETGTTVLIHLPLGPDR